VAIKRGIVCPAGQWNMLGAGGFLESKGNPYDDDDWKYFLLYWDEIICANPVFSGIQISGGLPGLRETGHFFEVDIHFTPEFGLFDPCQFAARQAYRELVRNKNGEVWGLHQFGDAFNWGCTQETETPALRMKLANRLPAPTGLKSFEDILHFKEHRKDEFEQFHDGLDELYLKVVNSGDQELQLMKALDHLDGLIANIERVTEERFSNPTKRSLSILFRLSGPTATAFSLGKDIADIAPEQWKMPVISSLTAAGAACGIFLALEKSPALDNDQRIINYLSSARNDGIITPPLRQKL